MSIPNRPDSSEPEPDALAAEGATMVRTLQRSVSTVHERLRLQDEEIDSLRALVRSVNQNATDRLARVSGQDPEQLDAAIQSRMAQLEKTLTQSLAAYQVRTVDAVRDKVAPRISALETQLSQQAETIAQMREVMARTDANLDRLAVEMDRLLTDLMKRPAPAFATPVMEATDDRPIFQEEQVAPIRWKVPAAIFAFIILLVVAGWFAVGQYSRVRGGTGSAARSESAELTPIELARVYESQGNYAKAEEAYRELLKKSPNDPEVIRHLASVLYREDKIEESANTLKRLAGGN